ncbi:PREDICTED: scarecrow-like protein 32 [Tarenaya hassleriana]|uniref:scarecrow-like protein 32 n=1 Tax=Tarenaya hassleriana TaxID=28532 RepID=UPI00053C529F|nr:PREDICTED: scarecrow-like protein 32 [Tarenaya hassleriana]
MQFAEHQLLSPGPTIVMNKTPFLNPTRPWPGFPSSKPSCSGGGGGSASSSAAFGDANCMEQLLVHCANAIESNDATLAQQIMWVLHNIAPHDGDSNQRLTSAFLRALVSRAASKSPSLAAAVADTDNLAAAAAEVHRFSVIELAGFVDLTPWHRFGFTAANAAILEAVEGYSAVHIVDLSLTHCMQIPTLIDAMASRLRKPPLLKLTVAATAGGGDSPPLPPLLGVSYEDLGSKLVNFATTRNIVMEFRIIPSTYSDGFSSLIEHLRIQPFTFNEALVINCHMMLHYVPDETLTPTSSPEKSLRGVFLKELRALNPTIVTLIDEDADLTSNNLVCRLRSAFNYLWIPYDTMDTFLTRGSKQREWYEADISWKIENVVANEGSARVERAEPKSRWVDRMTAAGFTGVGFGKEAAAEVKVMLEEHAAGWGMKRDDDDHIILTWKGHDVVFATAWVPLNVVNLI